MEKEILEFIEGVSPKWRSRRIASVEKYVTFLKTKYPSYSLADQMTFLIRGLDTEPRCPVCNGILNEIRKTTCSRQCSDVLQRQNGTHSTRVEKIRKTMLETYGADNPNKLPEVVKKRHATMLEKYGALVSPKTAELAKMRATEMNAKSKVTVKTKYGVDNVSQIPGHTKKCKNTLIENYGVDHFSKSEEFKIKSVENKKDRYEKLAMSCVQIKEIYPPSDVKMAVFDNPNKIVEFTCNSCGITERVTSETFKYRSRTFGSPCSTCLDITAEGTSIAEGQLVKFVGSIYEGNIITNDRTIIFPYELDIVLPELNIAIEYCGLYWHGERKKEEKNYHRNKFEQAKKNGYQLITIFEDEWIHRNEIVKSRLIHKLSQKNKKTLYARKCRVDEISTDIARTFVDTNHIQGYVNSKYKLGLYHEDELVAVMCFSKSNASKGSSDGIELTRFCVRSGTSVVGGASKLFSYFTKNFSFDEIFSYSDLRWNTGNVYTRIGMTFDSFTGINYWYVDKKLVKRIHRFGMRKNKSDDQSLTEWENRKIQGYDRIWDCGNEKYIWKRGE